MAVTTEKSAQLTNADNGVKNAAGEERGVVRNAMFNFTQGAAAGDANSTADLVKLPAGRVTVFLDDSKIANSAFGASRTIDLGWAAYTGKDGEEVAADEDGLDAAQSVASAGSYNPTGTVGGDETFTFESISGVTLVAKCEGGTIPAAATLDGYIRFVMD